MTSIHSHRANWNTIVLQSSQLRGIQLAPSGTSLLEEQVTQYGVTEYGLSTCAFRSEADDHCCEAVMVSAGRGTLFLVPAGQRELPLSPPHISLTAGVPSSQKDVAWAPKVVTAKKRTLLALLEVLKSTHLCSGCPSSGEAQRQP